MTKSKLLYADNMTKSSKLLHTHQESICYTNAYIHTRMHIWPHTKRAYGTYTHIYTHACIYGYKKSTVTQKRPQTV